MTSQIRFFSARSILLPFVVPNLILLFTVSVQPSLKNLGLLDKAVDFHETSIAENCSNKGQIDNLSDVFQPQQNLKYIT